MKPQLQLPPIRLKREHNSYACLWIVWAVGITAYMIYAFASLIHRINDLGINN